MERTQIERKEENERNTSHEASGARAREKKREASHAPLSEKFRVSRTFERNALPVRPRISLFLPCPASDQCPELREKNRKRLCSSKSILRCGGARRSWYRRSVTCYRISQKKFSRYPGEKNRDSTLLTRFLHYTLSAKSGYSIPKSLFVVFVSCTQY